jgi:DNA-binding CsgD family transcriptional regulator
MRLMLLGREAERLALDRLLAEAREGRSGALGLVGEPGIGKTALLEYAAERADGMRLLRARGVQSEADVPFAGLAELLRPALDAVDGIPGPQAEALAGALALGPARTQDRFAIGAATLSLLSTYADAGPVALFVDDAHLLDASSAGALLFAARRLVADPIALVLTAREGEPSLLDGSDLRVVHLGGLSSAEAAELVRSAGLSADATERLYRATGGNPLALLELAPEAATMGLGPLPISARLAEAFGRRVGELPEAVRQSLLLAAVSDPDDVAALARAGGDLAQLASAEAAGLVRLEPGRVEFSHPLVRSAVYAGASPEERRAAHAALAAALPDRDLDKRAWHLAAASVGPSEPVAVALEQAGARARERSGYAVAAGAYESAGRLSPAPEERARRLLAAADAAFLAGAYARSLALLDEARRDAESPPLLAGVDHLQGQIALRRGPLGDGYRFLVTAARRIEESDPEAAVVMLAEATHGSFTAGDSRAMVAAAEQATALAARLSSPRARFFAGMALGMALIIDGRGDAGATAAREAVAILERSAELYDDPRLLTWAALGPMYLREEKGRDLIDAAAARARDEAAIGALPLLLHHIARDQATTDRWPAAEASYDEAIRLSRETGQRIELAGSLAGLAWLEARIGREEACRAHAVEAATLCDELGARMYGVWAIQALGDLELGLGRPEAAAVHHEAQLEALRASGIGDVDLSPAPELVDAYLRLGRPSDAASVAAGFVTAAEAKGQPWVLARAARTRGQLAEDADIDACFQTALQLHERTPDVFERARTRLAYGSRLRRTRKRVRAREELRAALEDFDRLGAGPWAEQARAELLATGETARRRDVSTLDQLTPQELQIARLLAEGRTTREAAAAVFLSPKTVEYHLRNVYRKLGISSREALAAALGEEPVERP